MTAPRVQIDTANGRGRLLGLVFAASLVCLAAGAGLAPARTWASWLAASYYLVGIGVGATLFLAFQHVAGGRWYRSFRHVPEALASTLPATSLLFFVVLALGTPALYPWATPEAAPHGAAVEHHVSALRQFWLVRPFFLARALVYLGVWCLLGRRLVHAARRAPAGGSGGREAALFLVGFALTFWIATMDWIMSLEPEWYSTVLWIYAFAGNFLTALATIALVVVLERKRDGQSSPVTDDQLGDLGRMIFGFSVFWVYIWFSQYMLTWYANLPEETVYYRERLQNGWTPLMFANVLLNWAIPFLVLLRRAAKRSEDTLLKIAVLLLVGHAIDVYQMMLPRASESPPLGLWEIAAAAGGLALFLLLLPRWLRRQASRTGLAPVRDQESLETGARSLAS